MRINKLSYDTIQKNSKIKPYVIFGIIMIVISNFIILPFMIFQKTNENMIINSYRETTISKNIPDDVFPGRILSKEVEYGEFYLYIFSFYNTEIYSNQYNNYIIKNVSIVFNDSSPYYINSEFVFLYYIDRGWIQSEVTYNNLNNDKKNYYKFDIISLYDDNIVLNNDNYNIKIDIPVNYLDKKTETSMNFGITILSPFRSVNQKYISAISLLINFEGQSKYANGIYLSLYISILIIGLYFIYTTKEFDDDLKKNHSPVSSFIVDSEEERKSKFLNTKYI